MHDRRRLEEPNQLQVSVAGLLQQDAEVPLGMRSRVEARVLASLRQGPRTRWGSRLALAGVVFAVLCAQGNPAAPTPHLSPEALLTAPLLCATAVLALAYARLVGEGPRTGVEGPGSGSAGRRPPES